MRSGFCENGDVTSWIRGLACEWQVGFTCACGAGMRRAMEEDGQPSLRPVASYLQYGWQPFDFLPDVIKGSLSRRPPPGLRPLGTTASRCHSSAPFVLGPLNRLPVCPCWTPAGLPTWAPPRALGRLKGAGNGDGGGLCMASTGAQVDASNPVPLRRRVVGLVAGHTQLHTGAISGATSRSA